jgi:hypothetical protein
MKKYIVGSASLAASITLALAMVGCGGSSSEESGLPTLPGIAVDHLPAPDSRYVGSPAIAILDDGTYVASHDDFGPSSGLATESVFRSTDRGQQWIRIASVKNQYWSTLFQHRGALYLFGTSMEFGNLSIRRSNDGGLTWTDARDGNTGLLRDDAAYHTAPLPFVKRDGRLWRAVEVRRGGKLAIMLMSIDESADLLDATNWSFGHEIDWNDEWNLATQVTGGWPWEETNVVSDGNGVFALVARLNNTADNLAPHFTVQSAQGRGAASVDPHPQFDALPGAAKKFVIRHDPQTGRFWALSNPPLGVDAATVARLGVGAIRNTLVLASSGNGSTWCINRVVLHHADADRHGFHYADWQFDGADLVYVTRTAFDDEYGGARSAHDANFMMFGRIRDFRSQPCAS